jgi:D-xylose transport system permease protein
MASTTALSGDNALRSAGRTYSQASERQTWRLLFLMLTIVVVWLTFNQLTGGVYITPRNLTNLTVQAAITGLVALGVGALIVARELDLSVGSLLGAVVVGTVWLQVAHGWGGLQTVAAALVFGLVMGLFHGFCTTKLRIPSFIVTLAAFSYLRGLAYGITGSVTLFGTKAAFLWFADGAFDAISTILLIVVASAALGALWLHQRWLHRVGSVVAFLRSMRPVELAATLAIAAAILLAIWVYTGYQGLPVPVAILGGVALVAAYVSRYTAFGRHIFAIGGNPEAARRAAINVDGVILVLFAASGTLAALGGVIQAARLDAGPPNVGLLLALDAISAAIVGGTRLFGGQGSVAGILLGTLFLASIQNGLNLEGVATFWQYVVSGVVLLAAVAADAIARRRTEVT